MTSTPDQPRVQRGVRDGGQYQSRELDEPSITLTAARPAHEATPDSDGFPRILCTTCKGTGTHSYSKNAGHSHCFNCSGTGAAYQRGPVSDAIKALGKARLKAARPTSIQLLPGDIASPNYREYGKATWGVVERVQVGRNHPTKFNGKTPIAYLVVVTFTDGRKIRTSSDAIFARQGANIDLAPFHAMARGETVNKQALITPRVLPRTQTSVTRSPSQ